MGSRSISRDMIGIGAFVGALVGALVDGDVNATCGRVKNLKKWVRVGKVKNLKKIE